MEGETRAHVLSRSSRLRPTSRCRITTVAVFDLLPLSYLLRIPSATFTGPRRIALPEGTTRDNVKLSVNPDRSLRITASAAVAEGTPDRSVYKDVVLPKDALLSDVSAKFEAEQLRDDGKKDADGASSNDAGVGAVSGLEITVGKVVPPQPKTIDIV